MQCPLNLCNASYRHVTQHQEYDLFIPFLSFTKKYFDDLDGQAMDAEVSGVIPGRTKELF